jgi:septum formation protein
MPTEPVLCLASASPRRRELLTQIGVPHRVVPAAIDETALPLEPPHDYVLRVARAKAEAVAGSAAARGLPVLAADTSVVAGGRVFGKPAGPEEALAMLETLSGATHMVLSAVVLAAGGTLRSRIAESRVRFRPIGPEELRAYCATLEPYDKAGGYAIQGLAAVFVAEIRGSYSGVMGLPLCETAELLRDAGIPYWTNIGP